MKVIAVAVIACALLMAGPAYAATDHTDDVAIAKSHLPALAAAGTYFAGSGLSDEIRNYRASGQYVADRTRITGHAREFLDDYLKQECADAACSPAIVFDFDDTLVSWYAINNSLNFSPNSAVSTSALLACDAPKINVTNSLLTHAQDKGVAVYVITGRPESLRAATQTCMDKIGITDATLILRQPDQSTLTATQFKSSERARIEKSGKDIVLSIGDQVSDVAGGHTAGTFVVPNPMYFIP